LFRSSPASSLLELIGVRLPPALLVDLDYAEQAQHAYLARNDDSAVNGFE
jgi:hypothetical protein